MTYRQLLSGGIQSVELFSNLGKEKMQFYYFFLLRNITVLWTKNLLNFTTGMHEYTKIASNVFGNNATYISRFTALINEAFKLLYKLGREELMVQL